MPWSQIFPASIIVLRYALAFTLIGTDKYNLFSMFILLTCVIHGMEEDYIDFTYVFSNNF